MLVLQRTILLTVLIVPPASPAPEDEEAVFQELAARTKEQINEDL